MKKNKDLSFSSIFAPHIEKNIRVIITWLLLQNKLILKISTFCRNCLKVQNISPNYEIKNKHNVYCSCMLHFVLHNFCKINIKIPQY